MTEAQSGHNAAAAPTGQGQSIQRYFLPDAEVYLLPAFLSSAESTHLSQQLAGLDWQQPQIRLYGRDVAIPRRQIWMGDRHCSYRYSGVTFQPEPWQAGLQQLCERLVRHTGHPLNAVLLNHYQHGEHHMGWHSDDEWELGPDPVILSLSLGQSRRFDLKHKYLNTQLSLELNNGDLLVMAGTCQRFWQHRVPKQSRAQSERFNLTFRYLPER